MRPHMEAIANGDLWGNRFVFAESDISDSRGYTSYLDRYGVLKLPTIVLFRNGHPTTYPLDNPLSQEGMEAWLATATQSEPLPRGASDDAESVRMQDAQAQAMERIRQHQQDATKQEEQVANLQRGSASGSDDIEGGDGDDAAGGSEDSGGEQAGEPSTDAADEEGGRNLQATDACDELVGDGLTDSNFEQVVMDKANDVFVLFYQPSTAFCGRNGTAYAKFAAMLTESWPRVTATHMNVRDHKSPFVFEPDELPVVMLFLSKDKRPLEYDKKLEDTAALVTFASEHAPTMKDGPTPAPKSEL